MSITDELREWMRVVLTIDDDAWDFPDRIDAEYQKAEDEWKAKDGQTWLRGYAECRAELMEGNEAIAADLEKAGWVRGPLDADGEVIHVGDVLTDGEYTFTVYELAAYGDGSWSIRNEDGNAWAACDVTHHEPTVEDVLREFFSRYVTTKPKEEDDAIVSEYAEKLREVVEHERERLSQER